MTIMIHNHWHQIGVLPDGNPLRAIGVLDDDRIIGRVVDIGDGYYRADFINGDGNPQEIILMDYSTAVMRVVAEAKIRWRKMN